MLTYTDIKKSLPYALVGAIIGALLLFAVFDFQTYSADIDFRRFLTASDAQTALSVLIILIPSVAGLLVGAGRRRLGMLRNELLKLTDERDSLAAGNNWLSTENNKIKGLLNQESGYFVDNWDQLITEKDSLREEAEVSSALLKVALAIGSLAGPDEVLNMLGRALPSALFADSCLIFSAGDQDGRFVSNDSQSIQLDKDNLPGLRKVLGELRPLVIENGANSSLVGPDLAERLQLKSSILIPFVSHGSVQAIAMVLYTKATYSFSHRDIQIASGIVSQATVVLNNANLYNEVIESHLELKRLMNRLSGLQEEERRRISRDLHDSVIQNLSSMLFSLSFLEKALDPAQASAADDLKQIENVVQDTITEIRKVIYDLRPTILDSLGLVPTLEKHLERYAQENNIETTFQTNLESRLPNQIETGLFRLTQEALNNIKKHAKAANVALTLTAQNGLTTLTIVDDGVGFDMMNVKAAQDSGFGLSGMRERATALGGSLSIDSRLNNGTKIAVSVSNEKLGDIDGQN